MFFCLSYVENVVFRRSSLDRPSICRSSNEGSCHWANVRVFPGQIAGSFQRQIFLFQRSCSGNQILVHHKVWIFLEWSPFVTLLQTVITIVYHKPLYTYRLPKTAKEAIYVSEQNIVRKHKLAYLLIKVKEMQIEHDLDSPALLR